INVCARRRLRGIRQNSNAVFGFEMAEQSNSYQGTERAVHHRFLVPGAARITTTGLARPASEAGSAQPPMVKAGSGTRKGLRPNRGQCAASCEQCAVGPYQIELTDIAGPWSNTPPCGDVLAATQLCRV